MSKKKDNKKVKIACDECNFSFVLKKQMVMTTKLNDDVSKTFFSCPRCNREYLINYSNKEIQKNNEEINKLFATIRGTYKFEPMELTHYLNKIEELRARNTKLNEIMKAIYGRRK